LEFTSFRESQKKLVELMPEVGEKLMSEKQRVIAKDKIELKIVIDDKLNDKLERLKGLLSHKNPNLTYAELLEELTEIALNKIDPLRRNAKVKKAAPIQQYENLKPETLPAPAVQNGHVSQKLKSEVWKKGLGQCEFMDPVTRQKCVSKYFLQIDHIMPIALGGDNSIENLRLLCGTHNLFEASRKLGPNVMSRYLGNS
jgi:hypothetical protein